jgi:putative chitinase
MTIDREKFFAACRVTVFGGRMSRSQTDGVNDLLDVWDRAGFTDPRWLAYILGGVFHEVGGLMVPVREGFAKTDAGARAAVAQLYASGGISWDYALPVNGVSYYGRGRIQNTHHANYEKLEKRFGHPFVSNPDLLLDSKIDAEVTIHGHVEGIWTGKKLADYFSDAAEDWVNARRIVNGLDKAEKIAGHAKAFYAALGGVAAPSEADRIRAVQAALLAAGCDPKGVDGIMGANTRAALRMFQSLRELPVTGQADAATLKALGVAI